MYKPRVRHSLSSMAPELAQEDWETLWTLFVAIGEYWELGDDPAPYKLRFASFLENRINVDPLYEGYYRFGCSALRQLTASLGEAEAYRRLFAEPNSVPQPVGADGWSVLRKRLAEEFMAIRLALGGFRAFGAINYRGYFGGALIPGEVPPYRTARDAG